MTHGLVAHGLDFRCLTLHQIIPLVPYDLPGPMVNASTINLPVINLAPFIENPTSNASLEECEKAADALFKYSAFAVRDPRVTEQDNSEFLDILEDYFGLPEKVKLQDCRPELHYQVGATPENTERPRCARDDKCLEWVGTVILN